jgi:hypothetical protein
MLMKGLHNYHNQFRVYMNYKREINELVNTLWDYMRINANERLT